jgi:type VI protein secretion system component Hcp
MAVQQSGSGGDSTLFQVPGIIGEARAPDHIGWLTLAGFEWGGTRVARNTSQSSSSGARAWAPQLRSVKLKRISDANSALFWKNMVDRSIFPEVKITWLRTGTTRPIPYFGITLESAHVLRISESSEGDRPHEIIEMKYEVVTVGVSNVGNTLSGSQDLVRYSVPEHSGG